MKPFSFPKKARILKRYEFQAFYSLGKAVHCQGFILVYKHGPARRSRIGITVSRKVGCAVIRNKVKRRIREYFRLHQNALPEFTDFHMIAKKPASLLSFQQTVIMVDALFDKMKKLRIQLHSQS